MGKTCRTTAKDARGRRELIYSKLTRLPSALAIGDDLDGQCLLARIIIVSLNQQILVAVCLVKSNTNERLRGCRDIAACRDNMHPSASTTNDVV